MVLTDRSRKAASWATHAIVKAYDERETNGVADERFRAETPSLTYRHLHWGRLDAEAVALAKTGFDVVVGADVLYGNPGFGAVRHARLLLEKRAALRASS